MSDGRKLACPEPLSEDEHVTQSAILHGLEFLHEIRDDQYFPDAIRLTYQAVLVDEAFRNGQVLPRELAKQWLPAGERAWRQLRHGKGPLADDHHPSEFFCPDGRMHKFTIDRDACHHCGQPY